MLGDVLDEGAFNHVASVDVMKINIEGFELTVIAGGNSFSESQYAPMYVFIENVSSYLVIAVRSENRGKDYLTAVLVQSANHILQFRRSM